MICSSVEHEVRCVQRKLLLEALAEELPSGTIRYSSKVVSLEESGSLMLLHLADGTILRTKVPVYMYFRNYSNDSILNLIYLTAKSSVKNIKIELRSR